MNPRYTTTAGAGDDKRTGTEQPPRTYPPHTDTAAPTCRPRIGVFAQVKSGTRVQLGSTEPVAAKGVFTTAACRDASALLDFTFAARSFNAETKRYGDAVELPSRSGKASVAKLAVGTYLVTITAKPNARYTDAAATSTAGENTAAKSASTADGIVAPAVMMASTRVLITVYVPQPRIVPRTATYVKVSNDTAAKFLFAAEIENKGDNAASWACCEVKEPTREALLAAAKAGAKVMPTCEDTCPAAVKRTASSATGAVLAVKTENAMPVGYFRVTLTVGRVSRAFYVRVVAQPVLRVALHKNFDRANDRFVFYATATTGATLSWKVNEVATETATRTGRLLTVARKSLPTGQETTVAVTATRGEESNVASVSIPAPINAIVNCRVLREDGEETVATALATRLRIKANVSGFDLESAESIRYRFGYARWKRAATSTVSRDASAKAAASTDELADMTPVFLSTTPAAVDDFNATAPLVIPAASTAAEATEVDVRFFVEVTINKDIRVRGVCRHRVTRSVAATKADGDRIAKQEEARAEEAAAEGDEDAVAETVANAMTVAEQSGSAKTNATARAAMAHRLTKVLALAVRKSKNATAAAAASSGSGDAATADEEKKSDMTPETKANYVDILSRMDLSALRKARVAKLASLKNQTVTVAGDASAPAAPETSAEAKEEADIAAACDDACRKEMKADVMAIVRTVLAPAADGSKVDVRANGKQLLDVLSAVAPDAETNKAAVDMATALAAQTPIGETSEIESDSITVAGASFPADSTDDAATAPVVETKDGSRLRWPAGVAIPTASADSTVSVAAVQQTTNSRPSEGLKEGESPIGRTTDFKVAVEGEEKKVADLAKPIRCVLKRLAAKNATRTVAVKFYDEVKAAWSTEGITNTTDSDSEIAFDVNHLTAFGGFEEEGAAPAAQPPAANPPAANPPAANPPAANPPAANPPAGQPPAANPPAANPPAGQPPAANPPAGQPPAANPPAANPPAGQPPSGPNANPPAAAPADESSGLSTGAKIGIGAGSVVLVAAIAGMFLAARRASAQPAASTSEEVLLEMPRASVGEAFAASPAPYRASGSAEVAAQPGQKSMLASL